MGSLGELIDRWRGSLALAEGPVPEAMVSVYRECADQLEAAIAPAAHHRGICLACNRPIVAPAAPIVVGDLAYDDREPEVRDACPECGAATALSVPWTEAPCAECGYGS